MLLVKIIGILLTIDAVSSIGLPRKLENKFDSVKKKMNKLMKGKKGNELFLDISELEYPRSNGTLRRVYREQWNEYYDCLKDRLEDAGPEKTTYPIALLALEGTSVTLKCKLCVSPAELHTSEMIEWLYNSSSNASMANIPIEISDHVLITPDERDLTLYNIQLGEAGIYWCQLEDTASPPYYVHVANEETEKTRPVRPETAKNAKNYPAPPENLEQYGLRVFTSWSVWSLCSACEKVGQRIRYGYCTISLIENSANKYKANESAPRRIANKKGDINKKGNKDDKEDKKNGEIRNESEKKFRRNSLSLHRRKRQAEGEEATKDSSEATDTTEENVAENDDGENEEKEKIKSPEELKELAQTILPIFRNKLPCRSPQTPKDISKIGQISRRRTEIMTGFCKIKCRKETIFEIRDKSGKLLESANNSAGIYSMVQGMPEPRPSVERITIYHRHDKKAELKCPGNLNADVPVVWQIGTKILIPSAIMRETNERITIDARKRILFKKLRFADSNIYSCWQRGELAGTIRLEVTSEVELKVDHRVFMIGAIVIIGVMLTVFWRAYKGRGRFTMH